MKDREQHAKSRVFPHATLSAHVSQLLQQDPLALHTAAWTTVCRKGGEYVPSVENEGATASHYDALERHATRPVLPAGLP